MQAIQLKRAVELVQKITGEFDKAKTVETINSIRAMLFRSEAHRLKYFRVDDGCLPVRIFLDRCRSCQIRQFPGVVLPANVTHVTELRSEGFEIEITDSFVSSGCIAGITGYVGAGWPPSTDGRQCPLAEVLPLRWLEADPPACGERIMFRSSQQEADCASVGVTYIDFNGDEQREDIPLTSAGSMTAYAVREFLEISFPPRNGHIEVSSEVSATKMGRYHPSIMAPRHKWLRLSVGVCAQVVTFRGYTEPYDLIDDTDLVEFGDLPTWRLAVKAYQFYDQAALTPEQERGLARILTQLAANNEADLRSENTPSVTPLIPVSARNGMRAARVFSNYAGARRVPSIRVW